MNLPQSALDGASAIELLAALVIAFHACGAVLALVRGKGIDAARPLIAEGVLAALAFSLAATLLKVIGLRQWVQIRTFATVFVLRQLLKRVFTQERNLIDQRTQSGSKHCSAVR